jgi:hypothetical protein
MTGIDWSRLVAILAILVLLSVAVLGSDRWLLPRLLPRPGQAWTQRDLRVSTLIAVGSMIGAIICVLLALEFSAR